MYSLCSEPTSPIAPHRGFNNKAREVLIGDSDIHLQGMSNKSCSDFDLRKRLVGCSTGKATDTQITNNSSPKSLSSTQSIPEQPAFDVIGEHPVVKKHKQLAQIGKTKSCMEFKSSDKRLIKTYQEDNILKMPSIDSDIDSFTTLRSDFEEFEEDINGVNKVD
uniref:Uncharacterized protein n=1 Tax=Heterorhabditis bacteriophora TaxID=37862 RepID=A0A1I7XJE7_HETBA